MLPLIIVLAIVAIIILWFINTQRSLVHMDENINNAMSQIGVQMSSRWDALTSLLDLTKGYAEHEYNTLMKTVEMRRQLNGKSTPEDVKNQENMITETLGKIMAVAESYPDLKANQNYIVMMNSVNEYENMVRQSRLIYNDSVTKLNREIRMFPTVFIANMLGFTQRQYLETDSGKTDMPNLK